MRDARTDHRWSRRRFAAALGAGAVGLGRSRVARAADGPRILLIGDSMIAGGLGIYLERSLRKDHGFDIVRRGKSSSGLARPDFFDWIEEAQRLVGERKPDVSVVMFGGNDVQGLYMGHGQWIRWPEPGWKQEYARRVVALCDVLAPGDEQVVWIGLPIMRPDRFRTRCQKVNTIIRAEMAIRPRATFIDTWEVLAGPDGEYADKLVLDGDDGAAGKRVRVRAGDGIHLAPAGARRVEAHVLRTLIPALENP